MYGITFLLCLSSCGSDGFPEGVAASLKEAPQVFKCEYMGFGFTREKHFTPVYILKSPISINQIKIVGVTHGYILGAPRTPLGFLHHCACLGARVYGLFFFVSPYYKLMGLQMGAAWEVKPVKDFGTNCRCKLCSE